MNRIVLIGNSGASTNSVDGQTTKVNLYRRLMQKEGLEVNFVDLDCFLRHPFKTLFRIRKYINNADRIVLLTAERGSKILIPFINWANKKHGIPFIFPLIGTSVLHYSIDGLSDVEKNDFLLHCNFHSKKPRKWLTKNLNKITYILPETDELANVFRRFYALKNVYTLTNFRETGNDIKRKENPTSIIRLVFVSRVMKEKGILDLLSCLKRINSNSKACKFTLDIFGQTYLQDDSLVQFNELASNTWVNYHGKLDNSKVIETISEYDLFVFPTRFVGEGTPGVIVEALIAGVPVLTSNFPQAGNLLKDGVDSLFFKMFDTDDLESTLLNIHQNIEILPLLKNGAKESGKRFAYDYCRPLFLKYVCGIEEEQTI